MTEAAATAPSPPPPEAIAGNAALRAIGLSKRYGRLQVVKDLHMEVSRGEIYGFLGRNGAGKTTTIRMLMGIIAPSGGEIEFFGERVRRAAIAQKRRIGYVSQSQHFYPWMSARHLGRFVSGFYPRWDHQEYDRLLRVLEIPPRRRCSQLSGGMRMKLALALALAHHPDLLILDEPTAGLDPVAQREFLEIVRNQSRVHGRTTLFSSHRIDEVERAADKVGIIDEGIMRYEGPLDALRSETRRVVELTSGTPASAPVPALPPVQGGEEAGGTPPPLPPSPDAHPWEGREGLELLRDESLPGQRRLIYRAASARAWEEPPPPGWAAEALPLEDIFLAYAGMKTAEL